MREGFDVESGLWGGVLGEKKRERGKRRTALEEVTEDGDEICGVETLGRVDEAAEVHVWGW